MVERFTSRLLADGRYELRANLSGTHTAYWSLFPNGFCDDNELGSFAQALVFDDPAPGRRVYFHVMTGPAYSVSAPRLGMVPGLENLRELGGYETADGSAFVRYGAFYRSNRLCGLDEAGKAAVARLGLRRIVDFRVPHEIEGQEDPDIPGAEYCNTPPIAQDSHCFHYTYADLLAGSVENAQRSADALWEQYRVMAFGSQAYRTLFAQIAARETPILFHCSAGKDRTGVAAALILTLLGVPRETIVQDYLLTRTACAATIGQTFDALAGLLAAHPELRGAMESFISVRQAAIESTLDELARRYPEPDDYFVRELGLRADQIADIREAYLIKHTEKRG